MLWKNIVFIFIHVSVTKSLRKNEVKIWNSLKFTSNAMQEVNLARSKLKSMSQNLANKLWNGISWWIQAEAQRWQKVPWQQHLIDIWEDPATATETSCLPPGWSLKLDSSYFSVLSWRPISDHYFTTSIWSIWSFSSSHAYLIHAFSAHRPVIKAARSCSSPCFTTNITVSTYGGTSLLLFRKV